MSSAEAERNLQDLIRAHVPGTPGLKLLQSVRDTLPAGRLLLLPDDPESANAPRTLEARWQQALRGAAWQPCTACAPFACRTRGAPGHAAVKRGVCVCAAVFECVFSSP